MLLSISSARHSTCCSCFQAAYLWSASHQVRRARVLGQSWRLFLRKDWDLSASVLTLQKNLKNKTCIALVLEMLLFWLISAKWVYRGRIIGSEAGGQAGRDAHVTLIFSNAQDYDQVPKKLHSEWGGGWLMCCSSNELPFCLGMDMSGQVMGSGCSLRPGTHSPVSKRLCPVLLLSPLKCTGNATELESWGWLGGWCIWCPRSKWSLERRTTYSPWRHSEKLWTNACKLGQW